MRPQLVRIFRVIALLLTAQAAMAQAPVYAEGGYADRHSVVAGGTIEFHIATSSSPFNLTIVNLAQPSTVLQTISGLTSAANDCNGKWQNGCGWPLTTQFTVPANWVPGYYSAEFPTSRGVRRILFVVRAVTPGSYSPIAVIQPTNTYVAYNTFGGKNVYDSLSSNNQRANIVSMNRPYADDAGFSRYRIWEKLFVDWMATEGRTFEVITDDEVDAGMPLTAYKAVVLIGHAEYWSLAGRQNLEAFSAAGGHIAIFAGNTMWFQVRLDQQARQLTVYKDANLDPQHGVNEDVVTVNWFDWPVFHPENLLIGASFRNAAYANKQPDPSFEPLPANQRTPYTVRNPSSWVFAGTGVTAGAQIAQPSGGIEVDGALFNTLPDGSLAVEGSDGAPLSLDIVATLPARDGWATITTHTNPQGGAVFNTGTRDWVLGLPGDPVVQQMTRNVLDRFATGQPFAYTPRVTPNRVEDRFNTPKSSPARIPGWTFDPMSVTLSSRCAQSGPTGLELTGASWTQLVRSFAVSRTGLSSAQFNLWLNTDLLQQTPPFGIPIMSLMNFQGPTDYHAVTLETQNRTTGRSVRLELFDTSDNSTATSPWIVLTPGWHSVTVSWTSPGTVELNVSGTKVTAFNSVSGQTVNALMANFAGSNLQAVGSICVDELQMRNAFAPASTSTSEIAATPTAIVANGTSTSTITVTLKDAAGNPLVNGGDTVALSTTRGTLSAVTDLGDGRYRATLTSGTSGGDAAITGTVNGLTLANGATVTFNSIVTALTLDAPAFAVAGDPFTITVTAREAGGTPAVTYTGTVHFDTSSPSPSLPADFTFARSDNGVHSFSGVILRGAGTRTLTVTDTATPALTATANIHVQGTTTTALTSSANPARSGVSVTLTATVATTALGGTPAGTVTFKDGATVLDTATLTGSTATLTTSTLAPGVHTLTAVYGGNNDFLTSTSDALSQTIIGPASAATSTIDATPASLPSDGSATAVITVQLQDADGRNLISGGDTVALATTAGTLSIVTDNGNGTYTATLTSSTTSGTATITGTVNATTLSHTATVTFTPGAAVSLPVTAPASATSGIAFTVTVTARDSHGNVDTSYAGTIHFTSSDPNATLPADVTFQPADQGTRAFNVILRSGGNRTVTVTDLATPSIAGTATISVQTTVLPPPASIAATTLSTTTASISWTAVSNAATYTVERSVNGGGFSVIALVNATGTSYEDASLTAATSYLYRVRAFDPGGTPGNSSAVALATTIVFHDDPSNVIRAADFTTLRSAINTFRHAFGLPDATYTNSIVVGAPVRAHDVTEMRAAINDARAAAGLPGYPYTETITAGVRHIKILHLHELQRAIGAAPGG